MSFCDYRSSVFCAQTALLPPFGFSPLSGSKPTYVRVCPMGLSPCPWIIVGVFTLGGERSFLAQGRGVAARPLRGCRTAECGVGPRRGDQGGCWGWEKGGAQSSGLSLERAGGALHLPGMPRACSSQMKPPGSESCLEQRTDLCNSLILVGLPQGQVPLSLGRGRLLVL